MKATGTLRRLTAFSDDASGGNPAGVWIGDLLPDVAEMQRIAAEVGYSETAFIAPSTGSVRDVRYFSPLAEVSFCGHATIATGVALGHEQGAGDYQLNSSVGVIDVHVDTNDGRASATLTSVEPRFKAASPELLASAVEVLGWNAADLDPSITPAVAYAGAWHLVLAVSQLERLNSLDYDFEKLKALMLSNDLTTLQLVWRASKHLFHSRNPFPVGGVVEDPATGAAAAALGGYLRDSGLMTAPFHFEIRQGEAMGRPSILFVDVPAAGGIAVSGTATNILESTE